MPRLLTVPRLRRKAYGAILLRIMTAIATSGIRHRLGGAHTARTLMLAELERLLQHCGTTPLDRGAYRSAVVDQNCLGKRSAKTRSLSYRHLADLYGLDHTELVFVGLLRFWQRDVEARPMLALCAALARDGWLAAAAPFVWQFEVGSTVSRIAVEERIEHLAPEHFSAAVRRSLAQNINSTLTKSGHLTGRRRKERTRAQPGPAAVSYALLLGAADGATGPALFETVYAKALDCSAEEAIQWAEVAARRGWIRFNRVGDVMEVAFPDIVSNTELERLHESN